ncbi:MAG: aminotransferase class V-fold PLP-dependent enzyme, partial [Planctomycetia bacterium]|nr:aminotransferase class V-fold PLP-dependent enzyme [Planctomycetia bacterium]
MAHGALWQRRQRDARVDSARETLASAIHATAREIVLTSGATESNNLALLGLAARTPPDRRHVVTIVTEHHAVLDPIEHLERTGFAVTRLGVEPGTGRVAPDAVAAALRPDTCLVSVMLANNETGMIHDVGPGARRRLRAPRGLRAGARPGACERRCDRRRPCELFRAQVPWAEGRGLPLRAAARARDPHRPARLRWRPGARDAQRHARRAGDRGHGGGGAAG